MDTNYNWFESRPDSASSDSSIRAIILSACCPIRLGRPAVKVKGLDPLPVSCISWLSLPSLAAYGGGSSGGVGKHVKGSSKVFGRFGGDAVPSDCRLGLA